MRTRNTKPHRFRRPVEPYRVNQYIKAPQVRLVGENIPSGIYSLAEALRIAQDIGEDLVEISPKADPPVCKVISYSKFKYETKKKLKEIKARAHKTVVKEIRMTPNTSEHDIGFKTKHALNFLQEGAKVEAYVQFRGREGYTLREQGEAKLMQLAKELADYGKPEGPVRRKGRRSNLTIVPHPNKK